MINKHLKKKIKPLEILALGIPTNIAVGPLGFVAELGIDPPGERVCFYDELSVDSTAIPDMDHSEHSRITLRRVGTEDLECYLKTISAVYASDEVSPRLHT